MLMTMVVVVVVENTTFDMVYSCNLHIRCHTESLVIVVSTHFVRLNWQCGLSVWRS